LRDSFAVSAARASRFASSLAMSAEARDGASRRMFDLSNLQVLPMPV